MSDWSLRQKLRESIIEAVNRGDQLQVETLLNKGADVDESEGGYLSKRTLLLIAVEKGHLDLAALLVNRGADLSASIMVNKREMTALDIVREKGLDSLVSVIEMKLAANQRLLSAVYAGNSEEVYKALSIGANINVVHKDGESTVLNPLFLALRQGHTDVASMLIQRGVNLHFTVNFPDQPKEDTAKSYARRLNQDNLANLIEQEIARQATIPEMNKLNQNSDVQQKTRRETGMKSSEELMDIEDTDMEEENEVVVDNPQRAPAGRTCIIS